MVSGGCFVARAQAIRIDDLDLPAVHRHKALPRQRRQAAAHRLQRRAQVAADFLARHAQLELARGVATLAQALRQVEQEGTHTLLGARVGDQRGHTPFGREHAKDAQAPDLKEFYQIGRTNVPDDHAVHARYGANIWPTADLATFRPAMTALYEALDDLGATLLEACALFIGERADLFRGMAEASDTILRVIHYPPLAQDTAANAVRAAAHEDINFITLLPGSTADGLEILRRDGSWLPIRAHAQEIVVDSGDMLQAISNGLFRSTTHRVVNPEDRARDRYSMPVFIHPRAEVDLTPLSSCVARTGGVVNFPRQTAGEYLARRLREIGLS